MGNLFGTGQGKTVATQAVEANGMQVQASSYGMGLTIVYGRARIPGTLIWYGDFQAVEHDQQVGKGGGGGQNVSYTYSSSFQLALCEGPITDVSQIWQDSSLVSLSDINGTVGLGGANQAAWSHLGSPENLQYPFTAWVGCVNLKLGSSPNVPNFNFLVDGFLQFNPSGGIYGADPSQIITDLLTSATHGIGFQYLGDLTTFHDYCLANSIFLSTVVDQETTMMDVLTTLLQVTNSNTAWSNGKLTVIPYGDESATGNGVTYTPPTTVQASFSDADYIGGGVQVERKPLADLYNVIRIEWVNPNNNYVTSVAEAKDEADISASIIRQSETIEAHGITDGTLAQQTAQRILQRALYIRNTYSFKTTLQYVALEPGDVIELSDSLIDLVNEPVRITAVEEQSNNELKFTCEEFPAGVSEGTTQSVEAGAGYTPNFNGAPDTTQPPAIFRAPQFLVDGDVEIWIGVCGSGANWGGANVLVSYDNVTYTRIGSVAPGCRYGTLTAALADSTSDPDTTDSFSVALEGPGSLSGGTHAEADNLATLMLVDQELIAYSSTTLNGDGTYTLGNGYLRRQCYATAHAAHAIGAPWMRVDDNFFRWKVDPSLVGTTVYIKLQAWNLYGGGLQSESSLTATTYVVGAAEEIPDTPPVPSNFIVSGATNGNLLTWDNTNPAAVGITSIEVSTTGTSGWSVLGQVQGTHYAHVFSGNATYYYRARSRSPAFIWSAYTASVSTEGGSIDYAPDGVAYQRLVLGANLTGDCPYNGDFEQWADGQTLPDGWSAQAQGGPSTDTTSRATISYTGKYSFAMQPNSAEGTASRPFGVQPGMRFNATLRANCAVPNANGLFLRVYWFSNDSSFVCLSGTNSSCIGYVDIVNNASITAAWEQLGGDCVAPSNTLYGRICLFNTNATYAYYVDRVSISPKTKLISTYIDGSDRISTVNGGIAPYGSIPPGASTAAFSYTSTTSSVTVSWTSGVIYRADGTQTSVASGSQEITGLSASTAYYVAIYYDEASGAIGFASESGAVGSPAIAYTSKIPAGSGGMILNTRATIGWYTTATPASGGGGGGGGTGCCLHGLQPIELAGGREVFASELTTEDYLPSPEGSVRVVKLRKEPWGEWFHVTFSTGTSLLVAGDHRFLDPTGEQLTARELRLQQVVETRDGYACIVKLESVRRHGEKVSIEVAEPHTYYVQGVLSHNKLLC